MVAWAKTVDWQAWAIFSQAIAILVTALIARATYTSWQRRKAADRGVEVAEEALSIAYEAEEVFRDIRASLTYRSLDENDALSEGEKFFRRYAKRIELQGAYFEKLVAVLPRVRAFIGQSAFDSLRSLALVRNELYNSLDTYVDLAYNSTRPLEAENKALMRKCRRDLWARYNSEDTMWAKIKGYISQVEEKTLPVLQPTTKRRL